MPCTVKKTFATAIAAHSHLIAQLKDNQPSLLALVTRQCARTAPNATLRTLDEGRLRHETRTYEVFALNRALGRSGWAGYLAAVVRVTRDINTRSAKIGLWKRTSETCHYVCDTVPAIERAAAAIRLHWGIENRVHYVRDVTFGEDKSRIRKNPGIFARLRSFALLRFNNVENIANARYRAAFGGLHALTALRFMERALNSPGCRPTFFLPVKPLARLFRRLVLEGLETGFRQGWLQAFGQFAHLEAPAAFKVFTTALRRTDWVVYAKPPFGGSAQVLAYLARYMHRAAIANSRLVAVEADHVAFTYKDYRRQGRHKVMRLAPDEFIRRFLLHMLPAGFHRIRHYGFLANDHRAEAIARCRAAIATAITEIELEPAATPARAMRLMVCPDCGGLLRRIGDIAPTRPGTLRCDTS